MPTIEVHLGGILLEDADEGHYEGGEEDCEGHGEGGREECEHCSQGCEPQSDVAQHRLRSDL